MFEVALEHAFASGIIREALDCVVGWYLALEQNVSDLDRFWQAVFARFASVVFLVALFEQDGFGFASGLRMWERFCFGCAHEVVVDVACVKGGVLTRGGARMRETNLSKKIAGHTHQ